MFRLIALIFSFFRESGEGTDYVAARGPDEPELMPDGRVQLSADTEREIAGSPLYNDDLAPVRVARRTWSTYNYAALWISMAHCIPTYMLASGLIGAGMSWMQALF